MLLYPSGAHRYSGQAFSAALPVAIVVLACVLLPAAVGANPIEDLTKQALPVGGGIDPHD